MITRVKAKNFGCLHDVDVEFSRLHALIGPNDSGKSTILRAMRVLSQLASSSFQLADGEWRPFAPGLSSAVDVGLAQHTALSVSLDVGGYGIDYFDVLFPGGQSGRTELTEAFLGPLETDVLTSELRLLTQPSQVHDERPQREWFRVLTSTLEATRYLALTEEGLRRPSGFLHRRDAFLSQRGEGLPGLYFMLRNDREEAFDRILTKTREFFPTVRTVRAQPRSQTELELEVELQSGVRVRAPHVSAGLLYFLAFAALPELLGSTTTVLLEEPENGLHPARIREVLDVFRGITTNGIAQIIMATHSPLVINELKPEEVSVVTRPSLEQGTVVTPIRDTPNFEKRASVYALGELWLSYADGRVEEPLFDPQVR